MAKEAVLQIRIDSDIKSSVEHLYRNLGTSFAEAVRIFASQSIKEKGFPFVPKNYLLKGGNSRGIFSQYANNDLINEEKDAFKKAMVKKHG